MNIEDVQVGQRVRLTIDRARFSDPLDVAYLLRQTPNSRDLEPIDGTEFVVFDLIPVPAWDARLVRPEAHTMVGLKRTLDGPKEYLAEASELELLA